VHNSQRIYAANSTGVWTSSNGGTTWTQSLGNLYNGCQDLALRTDTTTDYLFAACTGATSSSNYTIWRNQDVTGSGVWTMVQTAPYMVRTSLAIAPSQQSTIYAMAASLGGTQGYDQGLLAVFRSTSNGDSGTSVTTVANTDPSPVNTDLLSYFSCTAGTPPSENQGWYDNVLAVDPINPNVVWAGGVYLFRSDDGGASWIGIPFVQTTLIAADKGIHADQHAILFHPNYNGTSNQTMFVGNDGGVFRTDNALAPAVQESSGSCPPTTLFLTGLKSPYLCGGPQNAFLVFSKLNSFENSRQVAQRTHCEKEVRASQSEPICSPCAHAGRFDRLKLPIWELARG
jgi:hypothetical protein